MKTKNLMSQETVDRLRAHPYVADVTNQTVFFTPEFKQLAYAEYRNGKKMRDVFRDAGLDPDLIGSKRIQNFRDRLTQHEQGKSDSHNNLPDTEKQLLKRIRRLEQRNAYLEQENEFLKKIRLAEQGYVRKAVDAK